jgi:hypothetical protein
VVAGIMADPKTYNRWLFPPAALLVHLAIGQVRRSTPRPYSPLASLTWIPISPF